MKSLLELLKKRLNKNYSSFSVPGHKGNFNVYGNIVSNENSSIISSYSRVVSNIYKFDTTELLSTDDLYSPGSSIKYLEWELKKIYDSGLTVISTGGNTLCVQTMLRLFLPFGGNLLVARNIHKCVINTIMLLGITPVFMEGSPLEQVTRENFDNTLKKVNLNKMNAVFITSPSYFGEIVDIAYFKKKINNIPLLVDNAHGAHLKFLYSSFDKKVSMHPLEYGADACADSAHKTLPVLTGGAFLHINKNTVKFFFKNKINNLKVKKIMSIFGSTSPSFLTLISIENCILWLNSDKRYGKILKITNKIKQKCLEKKILKKNNDPTRIILDFEKFDTNDNEIINFLNENKIESEFVFNKKIVLITTPLNKKKDWGCLEKMIDNSELYFKKNMKFKKICEKNYISDFIKLIFPIHETLRLPYYYIKTIKSFNKICAENIYIFPPGVVILIAGQVIDKISQQYLLENKIFNVKVLKYDFKRNKKSEI